MNEPETPPSQRPTATPQELKDLWKIALSQLELQMTKATFNTWLKDTKLVECTTDGILIECRNEYALEWLEQRLAPTVAAMMASLGHPAPVSFRVWAERPTHPTQSPAREPPEPPQQHLPGFGYPTQNWTQCPDFLFDVVLKEASPTAFKLVALIVRKTIGQRDKKGAWSEWWAGVSIKLLMKETNTGSRTSMIEAIREARAHGWVKRRARGNTFDYSLRFDDQEPDPPES